MVPFDIPAAEAKIRAAGLTPAQFCERVGISFTTWWRWRNGSLEPKFRTWQGVSAELGKLEGAA